MSAESPAYMLTAIAGGLGLALLAGLPLGWALGRGAARLAPRHAQPLRIAAGALLLMGGAVLWARGAGTFLLDAALMGLGAGLLVDAARRARSTPQQEG